MTFISAGNTDVSRKSFLSAGECAEAERVTVLTTILSALLIIALPAVFWLSLLELVNYLLSLGLTSNTRLIVAGVLIGILSVIWCAIHISARQRRSRALEVQLSQKQQPDS